jgi:hypothetical protein
LSNATYFAQIDQGWTLSVSPGEFKANEHGGRNAGPAILLEDYAGGIIAGAQSRRSLIAALEAMLDQARTLPEPTPSSICVHCGGDIRYVPVDLVTPEREWAHEHEDDQEPWKVQCAPEDPWSDVVAEPNHSR